jgi:hypothetical protein
LGTQRLHGGKLAARMAMSLTLMKADSSTVKISEAKACVHTRGRVTKMQEEDLDMPEVAASVRLSRKTDGVELVDELQGTGDVQVQRSG